jgi:hypothetical protein
MDAGCTAAIVHAMRKIDVHVIATGFLEQQTFSTDVKFNSRICPDRNVEANLPALISERMIAMFPDKRSRCEAEKPHRFQGARKCGEDFAKIVTARQQRSILKSRCLRRSLARRSGTWSSSGNVAVRTGSGSKGHSLPLAAEVVFVVVLRPFLGFDKRQVVLEKRRVETKGKLQTREGGGGHCDYYEAFSMVRDTLSSFDRLREFVMGDTALMNKLTRCGTEARLFAEVLAIGREHGFELEEKDLAAIVLANRRLWLERWAWQ